MTFTFATWRGQVTTGIGAIMASGAVTGFLTHSLTWQQATVAAVMAIAGLAWPENPQAKQTAGNLVSDVIAFVPLIASAIDHGKASAVQTGVAPAAAPAPAATVSVVNPTALIIPATTAGTTP